MKTKKATPYTARRTPADEGVAAARRENADQVRRTTRATLERAGGVVGLSSEGVPDPTGNIVLLMMRDRTLGGNRAAVVLSGLVEFILRAPESMTSGLGLQILLLRFNAEAAKR